MIQRKKKKIIKCLIITIAFLLVISVILWFIHNGTKNKDVKEEIQAQESFPSKSLIVKTTYSLDETYNSINSEELMKDMYLLEYQTAEQARIAYENLKKNDKIEYVMPNEEYKYYNDDWNISGNVWKIQVGQYSDVMSWGATAMGLNELQKEIENNEQVPEITIGIIDSGLQVDHPLIQNLYPNKIIKAYNALNMNNNVTDINKNGTQMVGCMLDATSNNV